MLVRLSIASLSAMFYCLWVRPGACPRVEYLKGVRLGLALALTADIRLGWKGLAGTNSLAYYENP